MHARKKNSSWLFGGEQDSSPTRQFTDIDYQQNSIQFTDTFEDSSPTLLFNLFSDQ